MCDHSKQRKIQNKQLLIASWVVSPAQIQSHGTADKTIYTCTYNRVQNSRALASNCMSVIVWKVWLTLQRRFNASHRCSVPTVNWANKTSKYCIKSISLNVISWKTKQNTKCDINKCAMNYTETFSIDFFFTAAEKGFMGCPILFLEIFLRAKFSSNSNQIHLNQLIKILKSTC